MHRSRTHTRSHTCTRRPWFVGHWIGTYGPRSPIRLFGVCADSVSVRACALMCVPFFSLVFPIRFHPSKANNIRYMWPIATNARVRVAYILSTYTHSDTDTHTHCTLVQPKNLAQSIGYVTHFRCTLIRFGFSKRRSPFHAMPFGHNPFAVRATERTHTRSSRRSRLRVNEGISAFGFPCRSVCRSGSSGHVFRGPFSSAKSNRKRGKRPSNGLISLNSSSNASNEIQSRLLGKHDVESFAIMHKQRDPILAKNSCAA